MTDDKVVQGKSSYKGKGGYGGGSHNKMLSFYKLNIAMYVDNLEMKT